MSKACLIVDDSHVVRKISRRVIEDLGLECREAENGEVAHHLCAEAMPDVILLDWNMPKMNGIDFLHKLRKMKKGKAPKVIFCTIETDVARIKEAIEAGADEYIMKPFDNDIIQSKLRITGVMK